MQCSVFIHKWKHKIFRILERGSERTISLNKYRSEITTQWKNISLDYVIDPILGNINRLFDLSIKDGGNDPARDSFDKYYMPLVKIKDF